MAKIFKHSGRQTTEVNEITKMEETEKKGVG